MNDEQQFPAEQNRADVVQGVPAQPYIMQPVKPRAPKAKGGAKVFLIVLITVGIVSTLVFFGYGVYIFLTNLPFSHVPFERPEPESPWDVSSQVSSRPTVPQPDIDITPNRQGIALQPVPKEQEELTIKEVYRQIAPSTVTVLVDYTRTDGKTVTATGTGIVASADGYIITNSHVVQDTKQVKVSVLTYEGEEYKAVVIGYDTATDLAVIKTDAKGLTPAVFADAQEMEIGDYIVAIGNPGGRQYAFSASDGIISGMNRAETGDYSANGMMYIQTNAAINPGNSGGPMANRYGQIIGINSSKIVADGYENMSFAIPVRQAMPIINDLMGSHYVTGRVRLGISAQGITTAQQSEYGLPGGVRIVQIDADSPFAGTSVAENDIITAVNGEEVDSVAALKNQLLRYAPGQTVTVSVFHYTARGGYSTDIDVVLLADLGETQQ